MMNKIILKVTKIVPLFLFLLLMISCVDDDDNGNVIEGNNSIIEYITKNPEYSLFQQLIEKANYDAALDGNSGSLTILAPNNEAMETYFQANNISGIEEITEAEAFSLVRYHLLETITYEENFVTGYLKTLSAVPLTDSTETNLNLLINAQEENVRFNGNVEFTQTDIEVDNGLFHEINGVLGLPTLETFLEADSNLSPFYEAALQNNAEIINEFTSEENKTLFIPSADLFTTYWENANLSSDEINQFFNYHALDGLMITSRLKTGYTNTLAAINITNEEKALSLYVNKEVGLLLNGTASITVQDIVTTNGVIHALSDVLTLPTLTDFINADNDLNTLVEAFNREDIVSEDYLGRLATMNDSQTPYTVFAPINEAFEDVLIELYPEQNASLEELSEADLISILNLHIAPNLDLELNNYNSSTITTLGGDISIDTEAPSLMDSNQRTSNILDKRAQAMNGSLFKIDTVLLP